MIKKKVQDLQEMGVPCSFCYCTPWTGGLYITGDQRIGREVKAITNRILRSLEEREENDEEEGERDKPMAVFQLPRLKVPLRELNQRTLVSMLIGIAKDSRLRWDGDQPRWWPDGIPFVHPREPPVHFKGKWVDALRALLRAAYCHFGCEDLLQVDGMSVPTDREKRSEQVREDSPDQSFPAQYFSVITSKSGPTAPSRLTGEPLVASSPEREEPRVQVFTRSLPIVTPLTTTQQSFPPGHLHNGTTTASLTTSRDSGHLQLFTQNYPVIMPIARTTEASTIPQARTTVSRPTQELQIHLLTPTFPAILPIGRPQRPPALARSQSEEAQTSRVSSAKNGETVVKFLQPLAVPAPVQNTQLSPTGQHQQGQARTPDARAEQGASRIQVFTNPGAIIRPVRSPQRATNLKRRRRKEPQATGPWQKRCKNDFHYYEYVPNAARRQRRK